MYTALLVDDEKSVLEILQSHMDWQQLGVNALLTAPDGVEALRVFERRPVDLLITDIRMPHMDGLELIRTVRRLYPKTHCILLTAYGEFDYAKEAITLGVENYLLKPVAKDEFESTVQNALENLYRQRQSSESLLRENTLRRWIHGTIGGEELSERAAILGINMYLPEYCVLCIAKKSDDCSLNGFRALCMEELSKQHEVHHLWDDAGRCVVIVGSKRQNREEMIHMLETIADQCGLRSGVAAALGATVQETDTLHYSYQTACDDLNVAKLSDERLVIPNEPHGTMYEIDYLSEELRSLFYQQDEQERRTAAQGIAVRLCRAAHESEYSQALTRLVKTCLHTLVAELPAMPGLQDEIYSQVQCLESVENAATFLTLAEQELGYACRLFRNRFMELSPIIQLTVRYIRDSIRLGEGVSIKDFCGSRGINPAYLGHLFKKETGIFFNDYATNCRVHASLLLLKDPERKIKDIASEVGFMSVSYYVKCFKSLKGITPAKYRMSVL